MCTAWTERRHLELHRDLPQLLDRSRAAHVAPPDERDRLVPPLDERPVHRVLQDGRVTVVVLAGEHDEAVGSVDRVAERSDVVARVITPGTGRRHAVEEGEHVVAQVDPLEVELRMLGQVAADPLGDEAAEATFTGGAGDHRDAHAAHGSACTFNQIVDDFGWNRSRSAE
jgi:hypothetical protein